jgi:ELWxxDGT repeat protein
MRLLRPRAPLALAVYFFLAFRTFAGGPLLPYLVKDLSPEEGIMAPRLPFWSAALGEVVFFGVAEEKVGLWRTDGTANGTHRVYDGLPDRHFDPVAPPAKANGLLYYPVVTTEGTWLYRTDGTTPGTSAIAKISGWYGGAACGAGKLCFATEGSRIAVTDGTAAGTTELLSTASGYETYRFRYMTSLGNRAFFNAYDDKNGLCMRVGAGAGDRQICGELWTTDGTAAGTHLFRDLLPGGAPGAPEHLFASSAGKLYFVAADPVNPNVARVWVSDGTAEGTRALPATSDWAGTPTFDEIAGRVFFTTSSGDAFESDGTPEGTRSLRQRFATDASLKALDAVNGKVLLSASRYPRNELWAWDGNTVTSLGEFTTFLRHLGSLQSTGLVYFITDKGDVWSTDGSVAGTRRQFGVPAGGATMYPVAVTPTRLYYGEHYRRWVTDGTEAGTHQIGINVPLANSTWISEATVLDGKFFFVFAGKVAASDGTAGGTAILADRGSLPFAHEGHTYFHDGATLWKTDGTAAGTARAREWLGVDWPRPPAFIGDQAIFAEATSPGRVLRRDADGKLQELGVTGSGYSSFVSVAGGVAFWAGPSLRLMFTDGTVVGTQTVASGFQTASDLVPLGAKAVFGARKEQSGLSLWVTDFTTEGTRSVIELPSEGPYDKVVPLLTWHNLSIFRIESFGSKDVWRSDGTAEGTFRLATGWFDAVLSDGDELVLVRHTDPGYEVWTSDGTVAGTKKRDVYVEGNRAGAPFVMPGGGVGVLYRPNSREIHIRNHRTRAVQVIDATAVGLGHGLGSDNKIFFTGSRGSSGNELWAVALDGATVSPPSSVRIEYQGMAKTPTGIGAVFRVHVDANGAKRPRVVATTVDGTLSAERDYVPFTREIVFEGDHDVTLVVPLRHGQAKGTLSVVLSMPVDATITQGVAVAQIAGYGRHRAVRH